MHSNRTTIDSTDTTAGNRAPLLALTIAYHPNINRVGQRATLSTAANAPTALSREEPAFFIPGTSTGEPLADDHVSRTPIHITCTSDGAVRIDVSESKTKVRIGDQRVAETVKLSFKDIDRGVVLLLGNRIVLVLHRTQDVRRVLGYDQVGELIGESDGLCRVLWDIKSVADLEKHVLIRGETGTGKELVATAIHRLSPRYKKELITVNLPAIPAALAPAALFGSEKGSFTGSITRHTGYFEEADGGTLFLDEIGDAPHELQLPLFRALDKGEIQTVGSNQTRKVNVRVIAATDADLEGKIAEGSFRAALLNRLATFEIWIPPLRERREDIGRLLVSFLQQELKTIGESHRLDPSDDDTKKPWFPASIVASLIAFDWPGNVRQLKNVVRQLVIGNRGRPHVERTPALNRLLGEKTAQEYATSESLIGGAIPEGNAGADRETNETKETELDDVSSAEKVATAVRRKPADVTEEELKEALHECRWDINATADKLGLARGSLYALRDRFKWFKTAGLLTAAEIEECFAACNGDLALMAEKLEVSESALARRVRELGLLLKIKKKKD